ncbi:MAG: hypothetical protein IPN79_19990 [Saprospiraceae bacterium]|nr:hypothetical protein [Saprospiraceae bacterium]
MDNYTTALYNDNSGTVWIGTQEGLQKLRVKIF